MRKIIFILSSVLFFMTSCKNVSQEPRFVNFRGVVFGTYYSISYYCPRGEVYQESIDSLFREFNSSLSAYDPHSLLSRINRNETDTADAFFLPVLQRSLEIAQKTGGAFDPTVSPLVNAWGFGPGKPLTMTPARMDSLRRIVGHEKVSVEGSRVVKQIPQIQFDFNAIAKGYASDLAGEFLQARGVTAYMVELGGDLVARGRKPDGSGWRIGLEKPAPDMQAPQEWMYLVEVIDQGVATSGSTRKYIEEDGRRYSHTIDPHTGRPVKHNLLSVTVFAPDCMSADAFATAFMVMGLDASRDLVQQHQDLEAFFIWAENEDQFGTYATPGINAISREDL